MGLIEELDGVRQQVEKHFYALNAVQLNWKPEASRWSIAQCLDHLMVTNGTYLPAFDKVLNGTYRLSFFQKLNPFKKAFGPAMVRSLGPQPKKKIKAPALFAPSASELPANTVEQFLEHQEKLKRYFNRLQQLDTENIVIASPVSGFITFSLSDAMKLMVVHEQRHLEQAMAVLHHPNFPS